MSKVSMPRPRYVAFRLTGGPVSRRALGQALRGRARSEGWTDADAPQLTRFDWPYGIVRVDHLHVAGARRLLPAITWAVEAERRTPLRVETLGTSGTLKALTTRLGVLPRRDPLPASRRP